MDTIKVKNVVQYISNIVTLNKALALCLDKGYEMSSVFLPVAIRRGAQQSGTDVSVILQPGETLKKDH